MVLETLLEAMAVSSELLVAESRVTVRSPLIGLP